MAGARTAMVTAVIASAVASVAFRQRSASGRQRAAISRDLWLVAEVVSSDDHHADTVDKKAIYEELKLPRLWMVDPRYDNVEVYHGTPYGLTLKKVLAGRDLLTEGLLPGFQYPIHELFAGNPAAEPGQLDF